MKLRFDSLALSLSLSPQLYSETGECVREGAVCVNNAPAAFNAPREDEEVIFAHVLAVGIAAQFARSAHSTTPVASGTPQTSEFCVQLTKYKSTHGRDA